MNLTIILIPAGLYALNRIPQVATLKSSRKNIQTRVDEESGIRVVEMVDKVQLPMWQRAIYFVLIGWWASFIWLEIAWLFGLTIIGLPLSFWMYGATGKVLTLRR